MSRLDASIRASQVDVLGLAIAAVDLRVLPYLGSFYVSLATQALFFGLFALSINLISGYGGMITLGHAALLGVAGYALGDPRRQLGAGRSPAAIAARARRDRGGVGSSSRCSLVRTRGTYFVMITLAEGMVVWGIALRWQELTGGENGIPGDPKPDFADAYWQYYYLVLVVVAVCTVLIGACWCDRRSGSA